jgi:hypothetical protein
MIKVTGSSNVSWYHYDAPEQMLLIGYNPEEEIWTRVYSYSNVPAAVYEKLADAPSKGEVVYANIAYSFQYKLEGELDLRAVEIDQLDTCKKILPHIKQ